MSKILHAPILLALIGTTSLTPTVYGQDRAVFVAQVKSEVAEFTHRRAEQKPSSRLPDGSVEMDLEGGMQHVQLVKVESGQFHLACADSEHQADVFFASTASAQMAQSELTQESAKRAAAHGMSEAEFEFYSSMIARANDRTKNQRVAADFVIVNNDGAGEGFNDPTAAAPEGGNNGTTRGQQRLNIFARAGEIWGGELDSTIDIRIASQFNPQTCSAAGAVLGSAGAANILRDFVNAPVSGTWHNVALANKLKGSDTAGEDINATFNSEIDNGCLAAGSRWYYGFDNSTPAQRINLLVVLLHEFGHGLGFQTFTNTATGAFNGSPTGFPDQWTRFMRDGNGTFWSTMSNAQRQASAIGGSLFWDGPSVKIASSGLNAAVLDSAGRVRLFAPNPLQPGSSVSHYDSGATPNLLMEPSINTGLPLTLDLTRQLMRDIGWKRDTNGDVTPDTIINVVPNSGSVLVGSTASISWNNTGGFNKNVAIELSTDGGTTFGTVIAASLTNTTTANSLSWTVPNLPTAQARIRVREVGYVDPAGVSSANFTISSNSPPTVNFAAATPSAQAGSPLGSAVSLGTVSDAQTLAGSIAVTATPPANITVSNITNASGSITARFQAACAANTGSTQLSIPVPFRATDGGGGFTDVNINLAVPANTPPAFAYAAANVVVNQGAGVTVTPSTAVSDNGSVSSASILSQGSFNATISVANTGVVTISNAAPAGNHTITVRLTDNCGAISDRSFTLAVNALPTLSAQSITRTAGGNANTVTLGTISDATTPSANLAVTLPTASSGITISNLINTSGTVTATVGASCTALTPGSVGFTVGDGTGTAIVSAPVTVTANPVPVLGYNSTTLNLAAGTTITPSIALSDNGSINQIFIQSQGTYLGSASVNSSGVITLSNATPAGNHTLLVRVIDNCTASVDINVPIVVNAAPTFAAGSNIAIQRGSVLANTNLGTASDALTPAANLQLAAGASSAGISLSALSINSSGLIRGTLSADCQTAALGAGNAAVNISDGSLSTVGITPLTVSDNTPPIVSYANNLSVAPGNTFSALPSSATDNGIINQYSLISQGTLTSAASVDSNTGNISILNAGPLGTHTLVIRARDNCNATSDVNVQITVAAINTAPTFTAASALDLQQGSLQSGISSLGSVSDGQSAANTLTLSALSTGTASGISVASLLNSNGAVTAQLTPACNASSGTLQFSVSDGALAITASVNVVVADNTPPLLGNYPFTNVANGASTTVSPGAPLSDNGSVSSIAPTIAPNFGGSLSGVLGTGAINVNNAGPSGTYTVTVTATDNCSAVTTRSFGLDVGDGIFRNGFEE